jgi:hypothetical protein
MLLRHERCLLHVLNRRKIFSKYFKLYAKMFTKTKETKLRIGLGLEHGESLGGLHGLQIIKTLWTGLQAGGGTGGVVDWSPDR